MHCQSKKASIQETMPGARRRGRTCTAWMDNIKTWTGLPVEESIRMTEVNAETTYMVWPTLGSRMAEEQTTTVNILQLSASKNQAGFVGLSYFVSYFVSVGGSGSAP